MMDTMHPKLIHTITLIVYAIFKITLYVDALLKQGKVNIDIMVIKTSTKLELNYNKVIIYRSNSWPKVKRELKIYTSCALIATALFATYITIKDINRCSWYTPTTGTTTLWQKPMAQDIELWYNPTAISTEEPGEILCVEVIHL